jgi:hypothetical protein
VKLAVKSGMRGKLMGGLEAGQVKKGLARE